MTSWGWRPERAQGIWRHGALWIKPLVAASPWATMALCLMLMYVVGNSLTSAKGELFDLPNAGLADGEATHLVAIVMPLKEGTTVFFDDARYSMEDGASSAAFGEHLAERVEKLKQKTLLVLSDRRIPCGDIATFSAVVRASGVAKILFADKGAEDGGK